MRTDRTHACAYCRLRFPPSRRCPRCRDDRHVVDLTTHEGHMALAMREARIRRGRWLFSGGLASLAMAGTSWTVLMAPGWSETFLFVGFGLLLGAVFHGGWGFVRALRLKDPDGSPRGDVFEGRAVSDERLEAPGTRAPVLGFRLVGESVRGPVDDAMLAPFSIVTDEGPRLEVDPTHATLDVPVSRLEERVDRDAVWRWGGDPSDRTWRLGTLPDGARVQVIGTLEGDRVRGSTGQPVRVTRIDPDQKRS